MCKKRIVYVAVFAVITAGSVVRAGSAEIEPPHMRHHFGPGPEMMEPPPPSPENVLEHLTVRLKLTDEQQRKIRDLLMHEREQTYSMLNKRMAAQKQLHDTMSAVEVDEKLVRAKASVIAQVDVELAVCHASFRNRINALLTREQRVSMAQPPPPELHGQSRKKLASREKHRPCHMPPPPPCCADHEVPDGD